MDNEFLAIILSMFFAGFACLLALIFLLSLLCRVRNIKNNELYIMQYRSSTIKLFCGLAALQVGFLFLILRKFVGTYSYDSVAMYSTIGFIWLFCFAYTLFVYKDLRSERALSDYKNYDAESRTLLSTFRDDKKFVAILIFMTLAVLTIVVFVLTITGKLNNLYLVIKLVSALINIF